MSQESLGGGRPRRPGVQGDRPAESPVRQLRTHREAFLLRPTFLSLALKPKDGYLITHRLGCPFCYFSRQRAGRAAPGPPHGSQDHFPAHAPCRLSMLNMPANFELHENCTQTLALSLALRARDTHTHRKRQPQAEETAPHTALATLLSGEGGWEPGSGERGRREAAAAPPNGPPSVSSPTRPSHQPALPASSFHFPPARSSPGERPFPTPPPSPSPSPGQ